MNDLYPLELPASLRPKIWGRRNLAPFFGEHREPVGEAWFSFEENTIANGSLAGQTLGELMARFGPRLFGHAWRPSSQQRRSAGEALSGTESTRHVYFPILSKLLFPSQKLSVQVHPGDNFAQAHEGGPGKTEAWYIVDAEPGAAIALGLTSEISREDLKRISTTGEIEEYLRWVQVRKGECYFVPPGTIHSIGAGMTICEIQQNSDLTYRLYDFERPGTDGKPRPLHLDRAAAVAVQQPHPGPQRPFPLNPGPLRRDLLAACRHFAMEWAGWERPVEFEPNPARFDLLVILAGEGRIAGFDYAAGSAYLIPAGGERFMLEPRSASSAIRAYVPDLDALRKELERLDAAPEQFRSLLLE